MVPLGSLRRRSAPKSGRLSAASGTAVPLTPPIFSRLDCKTRGTRDEDPAFFVKLRLRAGSVEESACIDRPASLRSEEWGSSESVFLAWGRDIRPQAVTDLC